MVSETFLANLLTSVFVVLEFYTSSDTSSRKKGRVVFYMLDNGGHCDSIRVYKSVITHWSLHPCMIVLPILRRERHRVVW